jgi:hypothetical protein
MRVDAVGIGIGRSGNAHPNIFPYNTFATAGTLTFLALGNAS